MSQRVKVPEEFRDYRNLLRLNWAQKGWTQPDPISLEFTEHLQHGPEKLVLVGHRESTKTSNVINWLLGQYLFDPEYKVIYCSGTPSLAYDASYEAFNLIKDIPVLRRLLPAHGQRSSVAEGWDVAGARAVKDCSFQPTSIESAVTGGRANAICLDDPENRKNTETPHLRGRLRTRVTEYLNLRKSNKGSRFIVTMTPHTEDSLLNWFRDRGFIVIAYPMRFPTIVEMPRFEGILAKSLVKRIEADPTLQIGGGVDGLEGKPINPWRLNEEYCQNKLAEVKWNEFQMQYMLNTSPEAQTRPLRCGNLIITDLDKDFGGAKYIHGTTEMWDMPCIGINNDAYFKPQAVIGFGHYDHKVMTIDPAMGGTDECAYSVGGALNGNIFLFENGGFLVRSQRPGDDAERKVMVDLARIAVRWGVSLVRVESNFSMFASVLQPILLEEAERAGLSIGIENERESTNKEARIIDTLAPAAYDHRLIVNRTVFERDYAERRNLGSDEDEQTYMLAYQFTRITKRKKCLSHDDRLDSWAALVSRLEAFTKLNREEEQIRHAKGSAAARIAEYDKWVKKKSFRRTLPNRLGPSHLLS